MIYDKKAPQSGNVYESDIYQKIIDALPIPIFYRDLNGTYILSNKAHEKFTGLSRENIIGKSVFQVHKTEWAEMFTSKDKELLETPVDQMYETQLTLKDGTTHDFVFRKAVIRDSAETIIGIVGSINDVSEIKRTERKLEKAQKAMEVASHMIHKISAGIVMIDDDFRVVDSNETFAELMGEETVELYETIPGLKGADVEVLVPEVIFKMLSNIMSSGEDVLERDLKFQNRLIHVSVVTLQKNKVVGAVIRDMSAPMLVRDEIISRVQRIKKQNIDTVQKIAYLLGENAAETEEVLNSIIQSYKYGDDE